MLVVVYAMLVFCVAADVSTYQYMGSVIGCVVALGTLAAHTELVPSLFALVAAYAVLLLTALTDPGGWLWGGFIVGAVWIGGRMLRQHRLLIERLRSTAAELERSRALAEDAAVTRERTRLARELHDVIAHSVSVMVVQAGAAERMLAIDPERATRALGSVQATGREALSELRHLLGVLRTDAPAGRRAARAAAGPRGPRPARRAAARDRARPLGDPHRRRSPPRPGIELAAFRILQEALTNVLKHGHARRAAVEICYGPERSGDLCRRRRHRRRTAGARLGQRGARDDRAGRDVRRDAGGRAAAHRRVRRPRRAADRRGLRMTIRVAVVDDQALVRGGFSMILEAEPDLEVVGEAGDGQEALELCARSSPDVVLMDVRMPVMDGVQATRLLTGQSPRGC